jgi:hypothetical protein
MESKRQQLNTPGKIACVIMSLAGIFAVAVIGYICFMFSILALSYENTIQTNLPKIQQALDEQCKDSSLKANREGLDTDPVLQWSFKPQTGWWASCVFDSDKWNCTCTYISSIEDSSE